MSMTLRAFMDAHALGPTEMARRLECSESAVRKWYYGERIPRPDQMRRISEATFGIVTANDLLEAQAGEVSKRQRKPRGQ